MLLIDDLDVYFVGKKGRDKPYQDSSMVVSLAIQSHEIQKWSWKFGSVIPGSLFRGFRNKPWLPGSFLQSCMTFETQGLLLKGYLYFQTRLSERVHPLYRPESSEWSHTSNGSLATCGPALWRRVGLISYWYFHVAFIEGVAEMGFQNLWPQNGSFVRSFLIWDWEVCWDTLLILLGLNCVQCTDSWTVIRGSTNMYTPED